MGNFDEFVEKLESRLARFFPGVTLDSDVLEHIVLLYFEYNQNEMPEKCLYNNEEGNCVSISFSTPYRVLNRKFVKDLKSLVKDKDIVVEEINSIANTIDFIVKLKISDDFFKANTAGLLECMETLLSDPEKYQLYRYWSYRAEQYVREKQAQDITPFSMINIESQINFFPPYFFSGAVWSAIVRKASANEKLVVLSEPTIDKLEYSYQIEFSCEDESCNKTLRFPLYDIVDLIRTPDNLKDFLLANEFIPFPNADAFLREKLHREFRLKGDKYEIDLGFHPGLVSQLKEFGIEAIPVVYSTTGDTPGRLQSYAFAKKDCFKTLLAVAEIQGRKCLKERRHTLEHYRVNKNWDKLREQLNFFLHFKANTGLNIDYTELAFELFDHAKENGATPELSQIICDAMLVLTDKERFSSETIKKANSALHEITLWQITVCEEEFKQLALIPGTELTAETKELKREIGELKAKLVGYAQKAGLAEANNYLAELCGKPFGETFKNDIVSDINATMLEMADEIKRLQQENAELKQKLGIQMESTDEVDAGRLKILATSGENYALCKQEWEALKEENEMLLKLENLKGSQEGSVQLLSRCGLFKQLMSNQPQIAKLEGEKTSNSFFVGGLVN